VLPFCDNVKTIDPVSGETHISGRVEHKMHGALFQLDNELQSEFAVLSQFIDSNVTLGLRMQLTVG